MRDAAQRVRIRLLIQRAREQLSLVLLHLEAPDNEVASDRARTTLADAYANIGAADTLLQPEEAGPHD